MNQFTKLLDKVTCNNTPSEYERLIAPSNPIVVLLHSKKGYVAETNEMKEKLNKELGDKIEVIQVKWTYRPWIHRKIGPIYETADDIYKQIALYLLDSHQYGKNSKSVCKTIEVYIFGFDEKN